MTNTTISQDNQEGRRPLRALEDDRVISEQQLAELLGVHVMTVRRWRRLDAVEGTPGRRTPQPIKLSDHLIGYRIKQVRQWLDARAA